MILHAVSRCMSLPPGRGFSPPFVPGHRPPALRPLIPARQVRGFRAVSLLQPVRTSTTSPTAACRIPTPHLVVRLWGLH